MTVLYFQGFDMFRWVDGTGGMFVTGNNDEYLQWGYNSFSRMEFSEGYESHHAGHASPAWRPMGLKAGAMAGQATDEFRFGMWVKGSPVSLASPGRFFLVVTNEAGEGFAVRAFGNGGMSIYQLRSGGGAYTHLISDGLDQEDSIESDKWHHIEFYGNLVTGVGRLVKDGLPMIQGAGAPISVNGNLKFEVGSPEIASSIASACWDYIFDHVYVTDGDPVPDTTVAGVSINAAVDYMDGAPGFRSTMMFGDARYQSHVIKGFIGSGDDNQNQTNVSTWFWPNDPRGGAWTPAKFQQIDFFGLCYAADTASGIERVAALSLDRLDYNNGMPLVIPRVPGSIGSYSGPWTKSDNTKTFSALVNTLPRPNDPDADDTNSIFCSGPGCILFNHIAEDDDDRPVEATGLTFAEEFRTDYRDWVRVDGVGTSYDSFFTSGFGVFGEGNKKFQNNYITVNYENVQNGAAYIQGLWDYAYDQDTGRWSMRQTVYTNDEGYTHRARRLKIRGHGKALQIKVSNQGDNPFTINGWSMFVTSNGSL